MAVAEFHSEGFAIDWTPESALAAGDVVDLGNFVGIATRPIAAGVLGALQIEGIYKVVKKTGETWAVGEELVYDAGTTSFSNDASYSEAVAGLVTAIAAETATHGYIKLTPGVVRA